MRYKSYPLSFVTAIFGMALTFPWYVMAMIIFGQMTEVVTQGAVPSIVGTLLLTVFVGWYCLNSGQRGVVITDFIQGIICFFGMMIIFYYTAQYFFGGYSSMYQQVLAESPHLLRISSPELFVSYGLASALCGLLWLECFTRIFVAKGTKDARLGATVAILVGGLLIVMAYGLGVGSSLLPESLLGTNSEQNLLNMVRIAVGPVGLALLAIAIVAGEMSYIDSSIVTNSVIFSKHFVGRKNRHLSEQQLLKLSRYFVMFLLALAFALSQLSLPMLWQIAVFTIEHLAHFFPTVIVGIFWKRPTALACWAGIAVGLPITSYFYLRPEMAEQLISPWGPGLAGLVVNLAVFAVVALLTKPSPHVEELFGEVKKLRQEEVMSRASAD